MEDIWQFKIKLKLKMVKHHTYLVHKCMHIVLQTTHRQADLWLSSDSEPSHQALAAGSDMECFNKISSLASFFLNWLKFTLVLKLQTVRLSTTTERVSKRECNSP